MKTAIMKRTIYTVIIASILLQVSCTKFVDVPSPENQLESGTVFTDDKTATSAVLGVYSLMNAFNSQFANSHGNLLPAMAADEFYYGLSSAPYDEMKLNNILPGNSFVRALWDNPYRYIYHLNSVLEGLSASVSLSPNAKNQLTGEAKFLRAFNYFYLVNYFGDVPLILNTDYAVNTNLPRTPTDSVYLSIIADLKDAQNLIGENYPSAERTRANKAVVTTLLARVYLYRGDWALAETEASKVIADNRYSLLSDLSAVFLKNSGEALLQWQTVNTSTAGVNTWEGFNLVPAVAGGRSFYPAYNSAVESFEENDLRKANWLNTFVLSGTTYHYPFKYKIRTKTPVEEYSMVMRFAELYLIRAEARARQGKAEEARQDLNEIRKRAGLEDLPAEITEPELLLAVEKERRAELFAEWGHRWFDLKRTGRSLTVLAVEKPDITATDLLFPIPTSAILTNTFLEQNPGYN